MAATLRRRCSDWISLHPYVYLTLPDVRPLATTDPRTTAFIDLRKREAQESGRALTIRQRWVPHNQISNNPRRGAGGGRRGVFRARWCRPKSFARRSKRIGKTDDSTRGASTITQQLAKNLYLSPSRNPIRKLKELMITRRLEAALTKRRILEIYLNVIEWGDGIFGAEAAARSYFAKSAAELSPDDAALLAGAIINPREHNPARPTLRLRRRQQIIARRMGVKPEAPASAPAQLDQHTPAAEPPQSADVPVPIFSINSTPPVPPPAHTKPCNHL